VLPPDKRAEGSSGGFRLATLSTIHLSLQQPAASWQAPPPPPPRPRPPVWRALQQVGEFWREAGLMAVEGGVLGVLVVLPVGVLALVLLRLAWAALRRAGLPTPEMVLKLAKPAEVVEAAEASGGLGA